MPASSESCWLMLLTEFNLLLSDVSINTIFLFS